MTFLLAAYYLVRTRPVHWGTEPTQNILTPSECLNDILPDTWCLSWTGQDDNLHQELEQDYGLHKAKLKAVQNWGEHHFEKDWGWPNLFFSWQAARSFYAQFFAAAEDWHCLSLSLPEKYLQEVIEDQRPQTAQSGKSGLYWMLENPQQDPQEGEFLGFDIMGLELGGGLHSMYCHNLPMDYAKDLGIHCNDNGLIAELSEAEKAAQYTNDPDCGAEPVLWVPLRIQKYALSQSP